MIHVISTTGNPPPHARAKCLYSVASQTVPATHHYLEPPHTDAGFPHFPALINIIAGLDDADIVVSLDGDDWLAHTEVLRRVSAEYDLGAEVTYGQFVYADGRPGFASPPVGPIRQAPWTTTHLKTFRAGLFKKIRHADLKTPRGLWLEHARDHALMFPLVELAGDRARYIPDVLYVYNAANSSEFRHGAPEIQAEREAAAWLRSLESYEVIR